MSDTIVVVGAGGFGRETLDVIEAINAARKRPRWTVLGVADDAPRTWPSPDWQLGAICIWVAPPRCSLSARQGFYAIGVGRPEAKRDIAGAFDGAGWGAATLAHPRAEIGHGSCARIGRDHLRGRAIVNEYRHRSARACKPWSDHRSRCHPGRTDVSINPGAVASGEVRIGALALIGAGAVVIQGF